LNPAKAKRPRWHVARLLESIIGICARSTVPLLIFIAIDARGRERERFSWISRVAVVPEENQRALSPRCRGGRETDRRRSAVDHPRERFRTGWKPAAHAVPLGGPLSYSFTRDHPEPAGSSQALRDIPLSVDTWRVSARARARAQSILDHALLEGGGSPLARCTRGNLARSSVDRSGDAGIPYPRASDSSALRATSSASGRA